jgi:hypothetical protein
MIQGINSYQLDSDVNDYCNVLIPFGSGSYNWAKTFGRQPLFKGEKYYWAEDNKFLGRDCSQAIIAAINGKIYKIAYRFHDTQENSCIEIRERAYKYIAGQLGKYTQIDEFDTDHKVISWQTQTGNVILDLDGLDTELILTSSSVRSARKISNLSRLFGKIRNQIG